MHLKDALGVNRGEMVALVGAGGKTTTLFHLAKEFRVEGGMVCLTTTTKIYKPAKPHVDRLFLVREPEAFVAESGHLKAPIIVGAGLAINGDGKLTGLPPHWVDLIQKSKRFDLLLVEADGAASRLFKVPTEFEPVVPSCCQLTIWVMAIKAVGKALRSDAIHRSERAVSLLGVAPDIPLTEQHIVTLVKHPLGCLKGIPEQSRKVAVINQADNSAEIETAKTLGRQLVQCGFERIVITSHQEQTPVREVIWA